MGRGESCAGCKGARSGTCSREGERAVQGAREPGVGHAVEKERELCRVQGSQQWDLQQGYGKEGELYTSGEREFWEGERAVQGAREPGVGHAVGKEKELCRVQGSQQWDLQEGYGKEGELCTSGERGFWEGERAVQGPRELGVGSAGGIREGGRAVHERREGILGRRESCAGEAGLVVCRRTRT
ncbi:hypothetical protein NDU88_007428 [Pleurodeles waltl]|uniref:Uncharacterized protein n=1 Tax=Pleurodeles waltl TaxID=8319 RepID=A0AAV7MK82_PLEWA|nr:hypothetical protein NDU88_007428 [Pleurodeles waltl]